MTNSSNPWGNQETEFFNQLLPHEILKYIDSLGYSTTGRCLPLNSMENRVYEVEIENDQAKHSSDNFVIAKFYRPGRWSKEQIIEEHEFLFDLKNIDLPVIAPLIKDGQSLFYAEELKLWYCLFPKRGGRNPDELNNDQVLQIGRLMGRIHYAGKSKQARHRISLNPQTYGQNNLDRLLQTNFVPDSVKEHYKQLAQSFIDLIKSKFSSAREQRIHGDCHWGNLLYTQQEGFFFIDFDDMVNGPVVQDLWLLIPGRDQESIDRRNLFLEGYSSWNDFDYSQLSLIEPLRGLRYLHFDCWIAMRYEDHAFKQAFPYFSEESYWYERLNDLRTQIEYSSYQPQY